MWNVRNWSGEKRGSTLGSLNIYKHHRFASRSDVIVECFFASIAFLKLFGLILLIHCETICFSEVTDVDDEDDVSDADDDANNSDDDEDDRGRHQQIRGFGAESSKDELCQVQAVMRELELCCCVEPLFREGRIVFFIVAIIEIISFVDAIFRRRFVAADFCGMKVANRCAHSDGECVSKRDSDSEHQHEKPTLGFSSSFDLSECRHGVCRSIITILIANRHHQRSSLENRNISSRDGAEDCCNDGCCDDTSGNNIWCWKCFEIRTAKCELSADGESVIVGDRRSSGRFVSEDGDGNESLDGTVATSACVVGTERMNASWIVSSLKSI